MRQVKDQQNAIGATTLQDWAEFAAPAVFGRAVRTYARYRLADRRRPIFNLTVSNVPGPPFPLYSAGARMVANYPMGPINDGAGLNITVLSYMRQLDFGIVTCRELISDPWPIADGLGEALDELKKRAAPPRPKRAAVRKRATVVLVHGAWHGPWCWDAVVEALEDRGVNVARGRAAAHGIRRRRRDGAQGDQGGGQGRSRVRSLLRRHGDLARRERTPPSVGWST